MGDSMRFPRNERQAYASLHAYRHRTALDVAACDRAELAAERAALAWTEANATRTLRRERAVLAIFGERAK